MDGSILTKLREKHKRLPYLQQQKKTTNKEPITQDKEPKGQDQGLSDEVTSTEQTLESEGWYRIDKGGKRLASARLRQALLTKSTGGKIETQE